MGCIESTGGLTYNGLFLYFQQNRDYIEENNLKIVIKKEKSNINYPKYFFRIELFKYRK